MIGGRYRLGKVIGEGGSGKVRLAEDLRLGGTWAVKEMSLSSASAGTFLLPALRHPHIARAVDRVAEGETLYIVMDHVEGIPLSEYRRRVLSGKEALRLAAEICSILRYLHELPEPVLFADLKPSNLIVTKERHLIAVDLDAAVFYRPGKKTAAYGTRGYAAPECYRGEMTPRSDIYSAGRILRELLPPGAGRAAVRIAEKAASDDPSRRYGTAREMEKAVRRALALPENRYYRQCLLGAAALTLFLLSALQRTAFDAARSVYAREIAAGEYADAVFLCPDREEGYLLLLERSDDEGRLLQGVSLVRALREAFPEETAGHDRVLMRLAEYYTFGGNDPAFRTDYMTAYRYYDAVGAEACPEAGSYAKLLYAMSVFSDRVDWAGTARALLAVERAAERGNDPLSAKWLSLTASFRRTYADCLSSYLPVL